MTIGFVIQILLLIIDAVILVATLPALYRFIRGKSFPMDSIKACCALLAASFINGFFVHIDDGTALFDSDNFTRVISAAITGGAFILLLWVLLKTEKAMSHCGKP